MLNIHKISQQIIWFVSLLLLTGTVVSDTRQLQFDYVAAHYFWNKLYVNGGWTLYCGAQFSERRKTVDAQLVELDHMFSLQNMASHAGCDNRLQCHEKGNKDFLKMEADLHNMYPVLQPLITFRHGLKYGEVAAEEKKLSDCDVEWQAGIFEPREIARGNISRALLYMHHKYGIAITRKQLDLIIQWNESDPPSKQEKLRNDIIEKLQNSRNPFIDRPGYSRKAKFKIKS